MMLSVMILVSYLDKCKLKHMFISSRASTHCKLVFKGEFYLWVLNI